ncbi:MAG TPA: hypothetical protein VJ748_06485 [Vitreimonas sp.]|jgi:hypothetical protein|nr:hypothetical protein [Vitreimonas sp.]
MRRAVLACAVIAGLWCGPSAAQTTAYAPGQGSPNAIVLSVPVTASINSHCGFSTAPSGTYNQPDFDDVGLLHDFDFTLDCTLPMRVGVVSSNGGLLASAGSLPSGYISFAPYDVTLNLVGDTTSISATCAAATLTTGSTCTTFLGPASTTQGLRLNDTANQTNGSYLRVSAPPHPGPDVLVAATYNDTLVVTLSASP